MSLLTQERERISSQLPKRINYLLRSHGITPEEAQTDVFWIGRTE